MPIIKNNLYYELTTETQTKPVSAVKIQMDVLDNCAYNCDGCYVNRRNNAPTAADLSGYAKFVDEITATGVLVDEILIGPTDFLTSSNLYDVLSNPDVLRIVNENSPILAFTTTLMGGDIDKFSSFLIDNINTDTEIEIGIATQEDLIWDINYIKKINDNLEELSTKIPHDITYTMILNLDQYDLDYEKIHKQVVNVFDTTIDLVPSVARSGNIEKIKKNLNAANDFFNNLSSANEANNIMIDHTHSGMNFKVLNFRKGDWFISPFLYENMSIYKDFFKISAFDDVHNRFLTQYEVDFACNECDFFNSCASRGVILLMEFLDTEDCICPLDNMKKNKHTFNNAASMMYNWDNYTVDRDKSGYRKKFLIHEENIDALDKIRDLYNDSRK